jgi:hypothetical protein
MAAQSSYPFMPGMATSARTTSGRISRVRRRPSVPLSTVTSSMSSFANVIPTTF